MTSNQEYPPNEGSTGGNGNGGSSPIIDLLVPEEVQREQIITRCFYNYRSKSVVLLLSHNYRDMPIDSPIDIERWPQTIEEFSNNLRIKGVIEDHITKLGYIFGANHDRILNHYRYWEIEQTSAGQRKRRERNDRLKNTPPIEVSVSQALLMDEGNVLIKGMFVGGSAKVEKMYIKIGFRCGNCYEPTILADYTDRPRLQSDSSLPGRRG